MNKFGVAVLLLSLLSVSACSNNPFYGDEGVIRDKRQDYEKAQAIPRIQVPENLDSSSIHDLLVVPDVGTVATKREGDFEVPRPAFFYAEAGNDVVNMAREGSEKFILVNEAPADVWQKMIEFWSYNQIKLAVMDPAEGVMETSWIQDNPEETGFFMGLIKSVTFQNDQGNQLDKLRVKLAKADDPQKTAIRMQHIRTSAEEENPQADWSSSDSDVSYKSEMMYSLLHYLSKATESTTAVALQRRQSADKVDSLLGRDADGNPVLKVDGTIDHVWESIDLAMADAEMDVGSANRDLGKYYITYTTSTPFQDNEDGGFWGFITWLNSDREDITLSSDFVAGAIGLAPQEGGGQPIKYSAKGADAYDPNDLSQKDGYKIWLGGKVIYVFETGNNNAELNQETGQLEHTGNYQIKLNRRSNGIYVSVLTEEAKAAQPIVAEEILWLIKEHLAN